MKINQFFDNFETFFYVQHSTARPKNRPRCAYYNFTVLKTIKNVKEAPVAWYNSGYGMTFFDKVTFLTQ
jgi:hypothetical protein